MLRGSITALITPMIEDGSIDFDCLQKFVDWQIRQGTHGLVPMGTTGESATLSDVDHAEVVKCTVDAAAGRVPVIAGAGSNSTHKAIALAQSAQKAGADALLVVSPYYNKPSQAGLYAHFEAVHNACDLPIVLYNIPGRSVVDITVDTMKRLAELPRIIGVKDATGDLARVAAQRDAIGAQFLQMSGEDITAIGFNAMGGCGAISVTSNVAPALCSQLQELCLAGDYAAARAVQDKLTKLHQAMFMEPSPAPAKYMASKLGLVQNYSRLPMTPLSSTGMAHIDALWGQWALPRADY